MTAATAATAVAAIAVTTKKSEAQSVPTVLVAPSPYLEPWVDALPIMPVKASVPVTALTPRPKQIAAAGEVGRALHPAWGAFPPKKYYEVTVKEGQHRFHRDLPEETIWGYDGIFPGPTFKANYGTPILVRYRNNLPTNAVGPGSPEISVHLHNLHTPSESDGNPVDYFSSTKSGPGLTKAGAFKDHHYPMVYAGVDAFGGIGDPNEALGTMWYHDHRVDFTAPNVYRGLCGFFLAFDAIDSGNETHQSPALGLPSGAYDVPLVLNNVHFDSSGKLFFDQFNNDGFIGDKTAVNGKVQPYFNVAGRKYRFRFLNGSTARFYDLQLFSDMGFIQGFTYIANDGNLLPYPLLDRTNLRIAPAERGEIVIDFSVYPEGTELFLTNRLLHLDGRGPKEGQFVSPPAQLLKFIVGPQKNDPSRVPDVLRELPPVPTPEEQKLLPVRTFTFNRSGGMWTVNERLFDNTPHASPQKGSTEIWVLRNENDGWQHPVHIHFEEGRILSRRSLSRTVAVPPPAHERGRKDVYVVGELEEVRVLLRFRDFTGKYVMHCHNLTHEDHGMMMRWDIV